MTEVWAAVLPLSLYSGHVFLLLPWAQCILLTYMHMCMEYSGVSIYVVTEQEYLQVEKLLDYFKNVSSL